ncbi:hypothetical protein AB0J55_17525 [Amycolatopsis sp. NPDC049688]|uniref:hypothetical protein n=1 Tax=Amycolatopsis sp. NPDC049688 TaxID=3154733 RepID=UPI00343A79DD
MTTPQHNVAPASPISSHLPLVTGSLGVVFGIAALVLLLCVITLDITTAPMIFTAITAASCGGVSWMSKLALWTIEHQQACFEANRQASTAEIDGALKKVHKEVKELKSQWQRAMVARASAEIFGPPQTGSVHQLGVVEGGLNGMG